MCKVCGCGSDEPDKEETPGEEAPAEAPEGVPEAPAPEGMPPVAPEAPPAEGVPGAGEAPEE